MNKLSQAIRRPRFPLVKAFNNLKLHQYNHAKNLAYASNAYENSMEQLVDAFTESFVDFNIVSREFNEIGLKRREIQIDGLVGWNNFIHGRYGWGILCSVYFDNVCEAVGLYEPVADELYVAGLGEGCYLNQVRIRIPEDHHNSKVNYQLNCRALSIAYVISGRLDQTELQKNTDDTYSWASMQLAVEEARGQWEETDKSIIVSNGLIV